MEGKKGTEAKKQVKKEEEEEGEITVNPLKAFLELSAYGCR
jgi:hypothetical protein